jgi:DNA-binding winged helix-turn-helix (wHTH) protein
MCAVTRLSDDVGAKPVDGSFHIGPWLVDPSLNTVSRNGSAVHLEPKMMSVLVCLANAQNAVVSKQRMIDEVWKGTFVTEDVLTRCISELRKALEDDTKEPQFIQTIPRKGYRLVAEVKPLKPKRRNWRFLYILALTAVLATLVIFLLTRTLRESPSGSVSVQRLTTSGKVNLAAISPDGKYLVYNENDGDKQSLWLQQKPARSIRRSELHHRKVLA